MLPTKTFWISVHLNLLLILISIQIHATFLIPMFIKPSSHCNYCNFTSIDLWPQRSLWISCPNKSLVITKCWPSLQAWWPCDQRNRLQGLCHPLYLPDFEHLAMHTEMTSLPNFGCSIDYTTAIWWEHWLSLTHDQFQYENLTLLIHKRCSGNTGIHVNTHAIW